MWNLMLWLHAAVIYTWIYSPVVQCRCVLCATTFCSCFLHKFSLLNWCFVTVLFLTCILHFLRERQRCLGAETVMVIITALQHLLYLALKINKQEYSNFCFRIWRWKVQAATLKCSAFKMSICLLKSVRDSYYIRYLDCVLNTWDFKMSYFYDNSAVAAGRNPSCPVIMNV